MGDPLLLPAAAYDRFRKPASKARPGMADNRPPLNASPGELRLWQKLNGELDERKVAAEEHQRRRNCGLQENAVFKSGLQEKDAVVKSGRRAGLRHVASANDATREPRASSVPKKRSEVSGDMDGGRPTSDVVQLRKELSERTSELKQSRARTSGLEAQLRKMAAELEVARAEAESQSKAALEMQQTMEAAAKVEKARTAALGARMDEVLQAQLAQQQEWAQEKAALESERDRLLGRPPEEPQLLLQRPSAQEPKLFGTDDFLPAGPVVYSEPPTPVDEGPDEGFPEPPTPTAGQLEEVYSEDELDEEDLE